MSQRTRLLTGDKRKRITPSSEQFAAFLIWVEKNLSKSTLRSYRASIKFGLLNDPSQGSESVKNLDYLFNQRPRSLAKLVAKVEELAAANPWDEIIQSYKKEKTNNPKNNPSVNEELEVSEYQPENTSTADPKANEFDPNEFFYQVEKMASGDFASSAPDKSLSRKKDARIKSEENRGRKRKPENEKRTSALKTKKVDKDIYDNLKNLLVKMSINNCLNSKSQFCQLMLVCSTAYGLRPSEWANTKIDGDVLVVRNGKHSNGRANGPSRYVPITHSKWVETISQSLTGYSATQTNIYAKTFSEMTEDCFVFCQFLLAQTEQVIERSLDLVDRAIPEKRKQALQKYLKNSSEVFRGTKPKVSIYSGRHQFSANAKSLFPPNLVGDLMGHEDEKTCQSHYARKNLAHEGFKEASKSYESESPNDDKFKAIRERSIEIKNTPTSQPQPK